MEVAKGGVSVILTAKRLEEIKIRAIVKLVLCTIEKMLRTRSILTIKMVVPF